MISVITQEGALIVMQDNCEISVERWEHGKHKDDYAVILVSRRIQEDVIVIGIYGSKSDATSVVRRIFLDGKFDATAVCDEEYLNGWIL